MIGDPAIGALARTALGVEAVLFVVAIAAALLSRRRLVERLGLGAGSLSAARCGVLVLGTASLSFALDGCVDLFGLREGTPLEEFARVLAGARGFDLALALLALGIAPGVAEELLCRGVVQRGLEPRIGSVGAVLVAALCFGALHADAVHGGLAVLLGIYLGAAAARAGSTRPAVLCHTANNLLAVYAAARWPALEPPGPLGIALAGGLALACLATALRPVPAPRKLQIRAGSDEP